MPDYPLYHNYSLRHQAWELLKAALAEAGPARELSISSSLRWKDPDYLGIPVTRRPGLLSCEVLVTPATAPESPQAEADPVPSPVEETTKSPARGFAKVDRGQVKALEGGRVAIRQGRFFEEEE